MPAEVKIIGPGIVLIRRETGEPYESYAVIADKVEGAERLPVEVEEEDGLVKLRCLGAEFKEVYFEREGDGFVWAHEILPEHRIYGFGTKGGPLNKRGWRKRIRLVNNDPSIRYRNPDTDPLYLNVPFYILAAPRKPAIGVFIDNTYPMEVFLPNENETSLRIAAEGGPFAVYVIFAEDVRGVLEKYTALTGRIPLPPLWSLGFHQSKWSYSLDKALEVARKFRELGIPLDAIHFDIDYMDGYRIFTWSKKKEYSNPEEKLRQLHELGVKAVFIVDPYVKIDRDYYVYQEGLRGDHFAKNSKGEIFVAKGWPGASAIPDLTKAETRRWWGSLYVRFAKEYPVDGYWNDMNEPTLFIGLRKPKRPDIRFFDKGRWTGFEKNGNVFPLLENMATFEELKKAFPEKRFFVLSRSGYAGLQRYAANWTGDVWGNWKHLRRTITMILGLGLSGIPFVGADIGGFAPSLKKANKKMYVRWIQLGTFYPFMRVHYMKGRRAQEPYAFGPEVLRIAREFIKLRYRLLPYTYSVFYESHTKGYPVARPLFFEFPDDERAYEFDEEFMFGPFLLVVPVGDRRDVVKYYLPPGMWMNFWTWEVVESGGEVREEKVPLERMPLFVREGAVVAMQEPVNYVGEKPIRKLELLVFPSQKGSEWFIYEDDGISYRYEEGEYNLIRVRVSGDEIEFSPEHLGYSGELQKVEIRLRTTKKPTAIEFEGKPVEFEYDGKFAIFELTYPPRGTVKVVM